MVKTNKVRQYSKLRKKQKSRRLKGKAKAKGLENVVSNYLAKLLNNASLKTNNTEFVDDGVVSQIMSHIFSYKSEYKNRLNAALALNTKLLAQQITAINQLEKKGVDGASKGTRSKVKHPDPRIIRDPELAKLVKEKEYTDIAIKWNKAALKRLKDGIEENYKELISEDPRWDMKRMAPTMNRR